MADVRESAKLALESIQGVHAAAVQCLQGDHGVLLPVESLVDDTEAASSQAMLNRVALCAFEIFAARRMHLLLRAPFSAEYPNSGCGANRTRRSELHPE